MATERTCRKSKLTKQPLALVLIQTRFSPISNLDKYIPEIQDGLRRNGFPYMASKNGTGLELSPNGIKPKAIVQWVFENPDKSTMLIMDDRQVLLQTVNYDTFEPFLEQYLLALTIVMENTEHSKFGIVERLGLRYIDRVVKQSEADDIDSYLRPQLWGMGSGYFKSKSKRYAFTTLGETELRSKHKGALSIRILRNNDNFDLPPDLVMGAPPCLRHIDTSKDFALIDMDHGCEGPFEHGIKQASLEELFYGLHDIIIEVLYESVVSEEGIQKWK